VHGAIRDKWAALGWERGVAGYPLTDETTRGRRSIRCRNNASGDGRAVGQL
jgi:uncharacterized protein with LGFP repeats